MTFAQKILNFYRALDASKLHVPEDITILDPFPENHIRKITDQFFKKFYNDNNPRTFIFGINPGRFGAGVTGITFTDPVRLEQKCGISNNLDKRQELSSVFIYEMIERYGGVEKFYSQFYLTALSPLGFMKDGRNMNYYDDPELKNAVKPFIINSILDQIGFGYNRKVAICLGEGENFKFFTRLNSEHQFFETIIPLAHPRFIMQYRLRKKEEYIQKYLEVLKKV